MMYGRGFYDRRHFFDRDFYGIGLWYILIAIGLIILIISVVKLMKDRSAPKHKDESLKKILDERYIKGEITEEEYKAKKKFLDEN